MRLLLLTGPGGDAQGWGDLSVTKCVGEAADACGHSTRIAWVETDSDFHKVIKDGGFDLVWSALYYITPNDKFIGRNEGGTWVADVFDMLGIPYIGSNSQTMKDMIDKYETHEILARAGVAVPAHRLVRSRDDLSEVQYPAFVKPLCESRSVGISDNSVVSSAEELRRQAAFIEQEFSEAALVEEFLPGDEFTVLVLGNAGTRECLPGLVTVEDTYYGKHKVLRSDLRGVGLTHVHRCESACADEARDLAARAADVMHCLDHVRIDIKTDAAGKLRIMEVNGIPGLKPRKSWAPQLYTIYHGSPKGETEDYRHLIGAIVDSACRRYNVIPGR
jgi:D-alanine-D-alanine ligase